MFIYSFFWNINSSIKQHYGLRIGIGLAAIALGTIGTLIAIKHIQQLKHATVVVLNNSQQIIERAHNTLPSLHTVAPYAYSILTHLHFSGLL
jgi:hypothetical protein